MDQPTDNKQQPPISNPTAPQKTTAQHRTTNITTNNHQEQTNKELKLKVKLTTKA